MNLRKVQLAKEVSDEEGTTYSDTTLCVPVWLCNWNQGYFGFVPEKLYIKVRPINKGLESFVTAMVCGGCSINKSKK